MLKHFTEDTGQGYWSIIGWFGFVSLFKDRGYIGLFPDRWESPCIKEFLEDQFYDRSKLFVKGLKDYRFKLVWASSFMRVKAFGHFFYAIGGNLYIRHFGVWAGFKGGVHVRVMLGWKGAGV